MNERKEINVLQNQIDVSEAIRRVESNQSVKASKTLTREQSSLYKSSLPSIATDSVAATTTNDSHKKEVEESYRSFSLVMALTAECSGVWNY